MGGMGLRIGGLVVGAVLLLGLGVTMLRISGPAPGSSGKKGILRREVDLKKSAGAIVAGANRELSRTTGSPIIGPPEIRYGGDVLRIPVSRSWEALPRETRERMLDRIARRYVVVWRKEMKSHHEPAIVFVEGGRRVALHTRIDHWVALSGGEAPR